MTWTNTAVAVQVILLDAATVTIQVKLYAVSAIEVSSLVRLATEVVEHGDMTQEVTKKRMSLVQLVMGQVHSNVTHVKGQAIFPANIVNHKIMNRLMAITMDLLVINVNVLNAREVDVVHIVQGAERSETKRIINYTIVCFVKELANANIAEGLDTELFLQIDSR